MNPPKKINRGNKSLIPLEDVPLGGNGNENWVNADVDDDEAGDVAEPDAWDGFDPFNTMLDADI